LQIRIQRKSYENSLWTLQFQENSLINCTKTRLYMLKMSNIYISVQDNGAGIDKHSQRLIFDKFFQAEDQTIKKPIGSGLGLAISKKIVELHNGEIWVESEVGKGAKFTFMISVV
ncbi:ATP-binding protein, partial [Arcicella aquatica]